MAIEMKDLASISSYSNEQLVRFLKSDRVQLKSSYQRKTSPTFPKFHWYATKIEVDNLRSEGTGESFNAKHALTRAVGECIERIPIYEKFGSWQPILNKSDVDLAPVTSSNGVAYNLSVKAAIFSSYRELVERQLILDAWLKEKPVKELVGLK